MHLLTATVRNYRLHRDQTVEFTQSLTLIGGPNESGKSTLIEAIHRALFFRSNSTGTIQKQMGSILHSDHPEVEVRFHSNGRDYHLTKRFSGTSGTARLTRMGGETWMGDEAEAKLAELLGLEEIIGGKGAANKLPQQWAHLWTWQGKSGDDPCALAGVPHGDLVQRLQETGGAAVFQSECDDRVARKFKENYDALFVSTGKQPKPRKNSELDRLESEISAATEKRDRATANLEALRNAIADFQSASKSIEQITRSLTRIREEKSEIDQKVIRLEKLRNEEGTQAAAARHATEKHAEAENVEKQIAEKRSAIASRTTSLAPRVEDLKRQKQRHDEARKQADAAGQRYDAALKTSREARLRHELGNACVALFEKRLRLDELKERSETIRKISEAIRQLEEQLAALPKIDAKAARKLQKLESDRSSAEAALNAMAAGVEVISSRDPVRLGEGNLSTGEKQIITEPTELTVGEDLRLRIHPGGGENLAQARDRLRKAETTLEAELDRYGIRNVSEAPEIAHKRAHLESGLENEKRSLKGFSPDKIAADLANAHTELTTAENDVARRRESFPDEPVPGDSDEAKRQLIGLKDAVREADSTETEAEAQRNTARTALQETEAALALLEKSAEDEKRDLEDLQAQLRLLLETHGDDSRRAEELTKKSAARQNAEKALTKTREAIAALQPDLLDADQKRLERALTEADGGRQEAKRRRDLAEYQLRRDDSSGDPEADLALAEARLEAVRKRHESVKRKADAIRLLDQLFSQEQQALADRFTEPFVAKISDYLRGLFGTEAHVSVGLTDGKFSEIRFGHSGNEGTFSFEALSGGAREQVAAAIRLAMAEILAAEHGGSLPVIFDDAFAYSDPERVNKLQRMLDLAASRGLQVIILTCTPSDYATLGAKTIHLKPPAQTFQRTPSAEPTETSAETESDIVTEAPSTRATDELCDQFLTALTAADGKSGNQSLRETLDWDESTYETVKQALLCAHQITTGRGRGGSVSLVEGVATEP